MFAATVYYVLILNLFVWHSSDSECDVECSNVYDPVCGLVSSGSSRDVRRYQNNCHWNKFKCVTRNLFVHAEQLPDVFCGIERRHTADTLSGRRLHDFGIVGAAQECNHTCPTYCVDTYEPVCAQIWNNYMNRSYSKPIINHCHVDLFSCSHRKNVTIMPLTMCYSTLAKQLQFMAHVAAMKSLDLINDEPAHSFSVQGDAFLS